MIKKILAISLATAIGIGIGWFGHKAIYNKKIDDIVQIKVANELGNRLQKITFDANKPPVEAPSEDVESKKDSAESYIQQKMTLSQYHDYTQYYDGSLSSSNGATTGDYPSEEPYLEDTSKEWEDLPRIMEWEEIGEPLGEERVLVWHVDEGWMEDEETSEKIDDPRSLVGDCLINSGWLTSSATTVHIYNPRISMVFEVVKQTGRSDMVW